ncbi:unnamed protein product [Clonostachys chloroleuca]|uniref:Uncharacterized protein n=1 Tax=Clonostachys chloroleuca TaxID=1926264 RepID=A0AA35LTA2_9HYPO|nr:unnamed protein product [Clonostachys chloroleuca]
MQTPKLAALMVYLSATALAAPEGTASVTPDAGPGNTDFGPPCIMIPSPVNNCGMLMYSLYKVNLPSAWNDRVSALRPDTSVGNCRFYKDYNCYGDFFDVEYPGYSNLVTQLPGWNDKISSFRCFGEE